MKSERLEETQMEITSRIDDVVYGDEVVEVIPGTLP